MSNPTGLRSKEEWDEVFEEFQPKIVTKVKFADIFKKFLAPDSDKTMLEIGCSGGKFLCYLAKNFQFQPYGIDFSDGIAQTRETFRVNSLPEPTLFQEDLFTWPAPRRFDVVCSFGFVEHFENFEEVVRKHAELVAPGGTLIISLPHFAHLQYVFHWLIDRKNLRQHNTKIMNLTAVRRAFLGLPFKIEYLSYYKTFYFRTAKTDLKLWERAAEKAIRLSGRGLRKLIGAHRPNFLVSPEIICIATRNP